VTDVRRLLAISVALLGCQSEPAADPDAVRVGVLLSYSGRAAANSTNSERALQLAIETANAAGGLRGRPIRLVARDTHSDPTTVTVPAGELMSAGVSLLIGPDTPDMAVPLIAPLGQQVMILPSLATAGTAIRKPDNWFVMGTGTERFACEISAQLHAQARQRPVVLGDADGYDSYLAWSLTRGFGYAQVILPKGTGSSATTVNSILALDGDAYVLLAQPPEATALIFAMAAVGALGDPGRWYLGPTLHTPAFLATIPKGMLAGAHGVAPGTVFGAADFRERFKARWQDEPLDDAYPFYDAGAVAVLALQRALVRQGSIPSGAALAKYVAAVTTPGAEAVPWDKLAMGFALLAAGKEIDYQGLTGLIEFDLNGQTRDSNTRWWTIGPDGFLDAERSDACTPRR
jgi:branched-chain amino acid transport system substrate-binding protein